MISIQLPVLGVTIAFATLLVLSLLVKVWLSGRQARHVAQHRDQVPAAFAGTLSLASHQKAADYTLAKLRLGLLALAIDAVVLLGWTLLGGLDALNGWVTERTLTELGPLSSQLVLLGAFTFIGALISLPLDWYHTFRLEQTHGFNRSTTGLWLADQLKGAAIGLIIGAPLAALMLWLMGSAGATWWLWAWAIWTGFVLLMMVIVPTWIAPLFNRFEPLKDEALQGRVQALMQRCGFRAKGFYVMDGSRRSAHANAYFTGVGSAKRVVFFDTLLSRLSGGEVEAVLAHELGHFHHRHVLKRLVQMFAFSLLGFAVLGWLSQQLAFFMGLGVRPNLLGPNDALALILFLMVTPLVTFFITPLMSASSRRDEFQADAFACAHARGQDLSAALLKLYEDNAATLTPDPWYVRFYYSHPPAAQRLAAMQALSRGTA